MARDLSADSSGQVDRSGRTEEGDGAAELTAPVTSDLDVELVQPLHDVAVAHLPVAHVAGETGAPVGQRRRGWSLGPVVLVGKTEQVEERSGHTHRTRPGPALLQLAFLWQEVGVHASSRLQPPSCRPR